MGLLQQVMSDTSMSHARNRETIDATVLFCILPGMLLLETCANLKPL